MGSSSRSYSGSSSGSSKSSSSVCSPLFFDCGNPGEWLDQGEFADCRDPAPPDINWGLFRLATEETGTFNGSKVFPGLIPNRLYYVHIQGAEDAEATGPSTLDFTVGTAAVSITQRLPPPAIEDSYHDGYGEVTADAEGKAFGYGACDTETTQVGDRPAMLLVEFFCDLIDSSFSSMSCEWVWDESGEAWVLSCGE